jgi:hypothetical protein
VACEKPPADVVCEVGPPEALDQQGARGVEAFVTNIIVCRGENKEAAVNVKTEAWTIKKYC